MIMVRKHYGIELHVGPNVIIILNPLSAELYKKSFYQLKIVGFGTSK